AIVDAPAKQRALEGVLGLEAEFRKQKADADKQRQAERGKRIADAAEGVELAADHHQVTGNQQRAQNQRVDEAPFDSDADVEEPILNDRVSDDAGMDIGENQAERIVRQAVVGEKIDARHRINDR